MKLKKIDKARYQERRSRIQWAMIAGLFATSLGFAELYRYLFVGGESSLALNAAGVATGVEIKCAVGKLKIRSNEKQKMIKIK